MKRWSLGVSYLFHPLFVPLILGGLLLFNVDYIQWLSQETRVYLLLLVGLLTILLPISWLLLTKHLIIGVNWNMENRNERNKPLLVLFVCLFFTFYLFAEKFKIADALSASFLSISISLFVAYLINFFYKISLHSLGWGGFVGILSALWTIQPIGGNGFRMAIISGILILGSVMTARLFLKAHTPKEVYLGTLIGYAMSFLVTGSYLLYL